MFFPCHTIIIKAVRDEKPHNVVVENRKRVDIRVRGQYVKNGVNHYDMRYGDYRNDEMRDSRFFHWFGGITKTKLSHIIGIA